MLEDIYPGPVTYKKVTLERPQRFGDAVHIADELAIDDSSPYLLEFARQRLIERFETTITLRGTALYSYARFAGDCDLEVAKKLYAPVVQYLPVGLRDLVLLKVERWIRKIAWKVARKRVYRDQLPDWLQAKEKCFYTLGVREEQARVERIQEALLAQIHMLKGLKLKPQAVLASPDIVGGLMAYQTEHQHARMYVPENLEFAGLPVIMCPELIQGAIVV